MEIEIEIEIRGIEIKIGEGKDERWVKRGICQMKIHTHIYI